MHLDISTAELIGAADWDRLADRLCSLAYVQSKADTGKIFDLISEYDAAATAIPSSHSASVILPVLARSLRRNATFISRHPETTFQCFWNSCWWHDCLTLSDFRSTFAGNPSMSLEPLEGGPISRLMESWRAQKTSSADEPVWLRSLVPPSTPIAGQLCLEIPLNSDCGLPAGLSLSNERLVVWFRDHGNRKRPELRVWSCQTGEPLRDVSRRRFPFADPSLSPDKKLKVVFGGEDGGWGHPVVVSDAQSGARVAAFPTDDDHNMHVATFSPDGKLVAAGATGMDFEGYVYIWDLQSRSLRTILEPQWCVNSIAFAPTGDEILIGTSHGELEIWGLSNGAIRKSISAHDSWIITAVFSSDGQLVASASYDGTLRVWDLSAGPTTRRFVPHPDDVVEAKFSPDGHRLVTRSSNGTTRLWDGDSGKPIKCLYESSGWVQLGGNSRNCLFVGNYMIVSVAEGGGVWTSSDGCRLADVADRVFLGQSISFTTDGKRFAIWDQWPDGTGVITIHDIKTGAWETTLEPDVADETSSTEDGHFVATLSEDGEIRIRRRLDRIEIAHIQAHAGATTACAFSRDNALLVSGGSDDTVKVWDWETATQIFSADLNAVSPAARDDDAGSDKRDRGRIRHVKFVDDHTIAAGFDDQQVAVWNFVSGEHLKTTRWSGALELYPRQTRYCAEHRDDEVAIVESVTGEEVAWFRCGRDLGSRLKLVPHPNGTAWAGMLGHRFYYFAIEPSSRA